MTSLVARLSSSRNSTIGRSHACMYHSGGLKRVTFPSTDWNVTRFNPPEWYMQACERPMVLFLDELNRATNEVMQAAFQIVLDRQLNGWKLHPLTRVYAAINMGANYTVNEMDPALLDRF